MIKGSHHSYLTGVILLGTALLLAGCSGNNDVEEETEASKVHDVQAETIAELSYDAYDTAGWEKAASEAKISDDFSEALGRSAFQLAGTLLHDEDGEANLVFSPLSIYYSLAVTESGAEGETKAEIDSLLHMKDSDEISEECRRLMLSLSYGQQRYKAQARAAGITDYQSTIVPAASVWFSNVLTVNEEFLDNASQNFYASSYAVNFENPDSDARIEYWIRDMTNDVIYPRIDLPSQTLLTLVNTLYFYGGWQTPFNEEDTVEDNFTFDDGVSMVTASFCCRTDDHGSIAVKDGYKVSALQTENGCEMVIFLPDEGRSVDEFLQTPNALMMMMEGERSTPCTLTWKIPRFSFGSSYDLTSALKKLGVTSVFSSKAELPGISDEKLILSDVLHEAHISLDEYGVEGAAYTLMEFAETALTPEQEKYEMICDKPFIFGIRELNTGVWLFLGVCRNPAA